MGDENEVQEQPVEGEEIELVDAESAEPIEVEETLAPVEEPVVMEEPTVVEEEIVTPDLTPEEEYAQRKELFGVFADAQVSSNMMEKTITVDMDAMLPGKNRVTVTTDTANASWMILNDVLKALSKQIEVLSSKVE